MTLSTKWATKQNEMANSVCVLFFFSAIFAPLLKVIASLLPFYFCFLPGGSVKTELKLTTASTASCCVVCRIISVVEHNTQHNVLISSGKKQCLHLRVSSKPSTPAIASAISDSSAALRRSLCSTALRRRRTPSCLLAQL